MSPFVRYLLMACGLLSMVLGIIGIFLPLLPTTPFLLLSSYCFYKSSARLHHWLHHHRILGPYITSYMKYRAIKRRVKISSLIILWISLIFSSLIVGKIYVTLILAIIGLAVSYHILSLRTLENLKIETQDDQEINFSDSTRQKHNEIKHNEIKHDEIKHDENDNDAKRIL